MRPKSKSVMSEVNTEMHRHWTINACSMISLHHNTGAFHKEISMSQDVNKKWHCVYRAHIETALQNKAYQHRTVLLLEDSPLIHGLAVVICLHDVCKLSLYIRGTPHSLQGQPGLLNIPPGNKTVGGVRNNDASQEENDGGHKGQTHRDTPAMGVKVLGAVVDPLGNPDTDGGGHLEHDVEATTGMSRGNL